MVQEGIAWFGQYLDAPMPVQPLGPALVATISPSGQPMSFTPGSTQSYSVTLTNNGSATWPAGGSNPVHLGIHFGAHGGGYPGSGPWSTDQRISLPTNVAPGQSVTFIITVNVPSTPSTYILEYEMVKESVAWFGQLLDSTVTVAFDGPALAAAYTLNSPSPSLGAGGSAVVSITLSNIGSSSWPAGGSNPVDLGIHFAAHGGGYPASIPWSTDQRVVLPTSVAPNSSITLSVTVTAPTTPGTYTLEYQMVQEGVAWFSQFLDTSQTVGSAAPARQATISVSGQPSFFQHGFSAPVQVTLTNTGTSSWMAGEPTPVHLGIHFSSHGGGYPASTPWFTDQRVTLPADVPPGGSVSLSVSVITPSSPGSDVLEFEMVKESVAWFGQVLDLPATDT